MEDQRETRRLRAACEGGEGRRDGDPMETPGRLTPAEFIALFDGSNITRRLRCSQSSQTASQPQLVAGKAAPYAIQKFYLLKQCYNQSCFILFIRALLVTRCYTKFLKLQVIVSY